MTTDPGVSLRKLLTELPVAVVLSTNGTITFVNLAARALFAAADEAQLVGSNLLGHLSAGSVAPMSAQWAKLLSAGAPVDALGIEIAPLLGPLRRVDALSLRIGTGVDQSLLTILSEIDRPRQARRARLFARVDLQSAAPDQQAVRTRERRRIAGDLHDDLQQKLIAVQLNLKLLADRVGDGGANVGELVADAEQLVASAIESTMRIIDDLRPRELEELGLSGALQAMVAAFGRRSGIVSQFEVELDGQAALPALSSQVELCLYRVAQESLNNVQKHARAGQVWLRIDCTGGNTLLMQIRDTGAGLGVDDRTRRSRGLNGMRERVLGVGGTFSVESRSGPGTTIEVRVPFDPPGPADGG